MFQNPSSKQSKLPTNLIACLCHPVPKEVFELLLVGERWLLCAPFKPLNVFDLQRFSLDSPVLIGGLLEKVVLANGIKPIESSAIHAELNQPIWF